MKREQLLNRLKVLLLVIIAGVSGSSAMAAVGAGVYAPGSGNSSASTTIRLKPMPVTSIIGQQALCHNSTQQYTVADPMDSYLWTVTGGTIIGANNEQTVTVTWTGSGTGNISVVFTNSYGCENTAQQSIVIYSLEIPSIQGKTFICEGETTQLSNSMAGGTWTSTNPAVASISATGLVSGLSAGTAEIRYSIADEYCAGYASVIVTVYARPVVPVLQIAGDTRIPYKSSTTLDIISPADGIFQWYADAARTTFLKSGRNYTTPVLYADTPYFITLIGEGGCESNNYDSVLVEIYAIDLEIPEGFTPNDDGHNDRWIIKNIEQFPNNHVVVFNRWQNKVYEKRGYTNNDPWNGYTTERKIGNGPVPRGTYYYVIEINDGSGRIYKGFVEIAY